MTVRCATATTSSPAADPQPALGVPQKECAGLDARAASGISRRHTLAGRSPAEATRNICIMHTLEQVAEGFNDAGIPLLVLKGAALNLVLHNRPDERPMSDLDLLVRGEHVNEARAVLEALGGRRGAALVREDFFPRFYYETEYAIGTVRPVKIDLHVRPFRPLRYSRLVPDDALWHGAETVRIGRARVLIPAAEEMLIHLAVHAAIHGDSRTKWLRDMRTWADARREDFRWGHFLDRAEQWRLVLPVRRGLEAAQRACGDFCPPSVMTALARSGVTWCDRLALWQAPRDATHSATHVLVNTLCTSGWRFRLAYLLAVLLPGREHMGGWYGRRHWAWLPWAHVLRWLWPLVRHVRPVWTRLSKVELRECPVHGAGAFATGDINTGQVISRTRHAETAGPLRFAKQSCRPNARLVRGDVVALRPIRAGDEILLDPDHTLE